VERGPIAQSDASIIGFHYLYGDNKAERVDQKELR
jgi:hypothetical protein